MSRVQVYLPEDLYRELKDRGLSASELLQNAVRTELRRLEKLAAAERYFDELADEVGEPTAKETAEAEAWVDRVFGPEQQREAS